MVTIGSKLYFGVSAVLLLAAWVYGLSTDGQIVGVLTFGMAGPVGEQLGVAILAGLAAISFGLGVTTTAVRDADPTAQAQVAGLELVPDVPAPSGPLGWPVVAAFGLATVVVGLVVEPILAWFGVALIGAAAVEWTVTAWSERATGDPAVNRAVRNRIMQPVEIPAIALFGIALFIFALSRLLLAIDKVSATVVFAVAATLILGVSALLAARPRVSRSVLTALLLVGGLALIGGGIAGLAAGERDFEKHGHENEDEEQPSDEAPAEGSAATAGDTEG